jgi:2,4-dienoyl-CoA reductase-like NADH-dependent reductase (Old Yellow Enzyme family)
MTQYKNLFQPLELRHRRLDNRIVFGAHTANMSDRGNDRGRTDAGARHRGADAR